MVRSGSSTDCCGVQNRCPISGLVFVNGKLSECFQLLDLDGLPTFRCVDSGKPYSVLGVATVQEHQGVNIDDADHLTFEGFCQTASANHQQ